MDHYALYGRFTGVRSSAQTYWLVCQNAARRGGFRARIVAGRRCLWVQAVDDFEALASCMDRIPADQVAQPITVKKNRIDSGREASVSKI
jgi:hypothetical protein